MIYDIAIVGGGPAGITAALYAARKMLKTIVLTGNIGGQAALSADIENYTGFQFITGVDLSNKFEEHLKKFNVEEIKGINVTCVSKEEDNLFKIKANDQEWKAKSVVIATGRKPRLLNIPGEKEFKGKGVTYCATCDGPLFHDKDVAIIGGGNSALDSALQLKNIAKKVYIININDSLTGDEIMIHKVKESKNIEILNNTKTLEIFGEHFVTSLKISTNDNEKTIPLKGIFVEIGSTPVNKPACGVEETKWGELIINEKCETNIPGLFAAGDVTNVPEKQIIVAAGQGCIASLSAFKYLSRKKD